MSARPPLHPLRARTDSRARRRLAAGLLTLATTATAVVAVVIGVSSGTPDAPSDDTGTHETVVAGPDPGGRREPRREPADPPPAPEPEPVHGAVELVAVRDLSATGTGLFQPGSGREAPVPTDGAAIDAFVDATAGWLDAALTAENLGEQPATPGLGGAWRDVTPSGGVPVTDAHYAVTVAARGTPSWAHVVVTATRSDDSEGAAEVVFVPSRDGVTLLGAAGAGVGAADEDAGAADEDADDADTRETP